MQQEPPQDNNDEDHEYLIEQIEDLQEEVVVYRSENNKLNSELNTLRSLLDEERKERQREWRDTTRWTETYRLSIITFIAMIIAGVVSFVGIQLNTLLAEMRDKGERLVRIETVLSPIHGDVLKQDGNQGKKSTSKNTTQKKPRMSRPGRKRSP